MKKLLQKISDILFSEPPPERLPSEPNQQKRETWPERPPVVVVCPNCDSGIFQNRASHPIDCPNCDYKEKLDYLTEYEIIRFDCPDCGADIEDNWFTRDLTGSGPPETVTHVNCEECGMSWEAPSNY